MKCGCRFFSFLSVSIFFFASYFHTLSAVSAEIQPVNWTHLSSDNGELPVPAESNGQSGLRVVDLDGNGQNDYVLTLWAANETVVWYRQLGDTFEKHIIDTETPNLSHGEKFKDIDDDGDIDLLFADASSGNGVYWWENPYPDYDPSEPWQKRVIRKSGDNFYHDNIWGDFDDDGSDELIAWNQKGLQLLLFEIPSNPKDSGPWPVTQIFSWESDIHKYRGADSIDIDLDGKIDFVGGCGWFKHTGGNQFLYNPIDESMGYSQVKAGQLIPGGRPEVVCLLELKDGPLNMYEWTGTEWEVHTLAYDVPRSHTLQIGDVNSDGYLDIVTGEMGQYAETYDPPDNPCAKLSVFYGNGTGQFIQKAISVGQGDLEGQLADIDNDGDLDIVAKAFRHNIPRVDIHINQGFNPSIAPEGGTFIGQAVVNLSASTDREIYYTTDGSVPGMDSSLYRSPFYLNTTSTVSAVSVKDGTFFSDVSYADFVIESDIDSPIIDSVYATKDPIGVYVLFNEPVSRATAETVGNYAIDHGGVIYSASLAADMKTVILNTAPPLEDTDHTLTVNNVTDLSLGSNTIAPDSTTNFYFQAIPNDDFENTEVNGDPTDWLDTGANNSLSENNSLFKVFEFDNGKSFGTTSTQANIHSHYAGGEMDAALGYEFTGRMMITEPAGGIGVTFSSQYPESDSYYRLRRDKERPSFHIASHGANICGDTDTGVVPDANLWYQFRIQVKETGAKTEMKARVWPADQSEPVHWQIDAYDDSNSRFMIGTIGLWSYLSGSKYWDDLNVAISAGASDPHMVKKFPWILFYPALQK